MVLCHLEELVRWWSNQNYEKYDFVNIVKYLVSRGANITADDNYAVLLASNQKISNYLVSKSARIIPRMLIELFYGPI